MAFVTDPAGNEIRALRRVPNLVGKQVLEIGCGDGRLTQRLGSLGAAKIIALDPDQALIRAARKKLPRHYGRQIEFRVGHAEQLAFPAETFDLAVFSWVL